jgi:hypothetical protein
MAKSGILHIVRTAKRRLTLATGAVLAAVATVMTISAYATSVAVWSDYSTTVCEGGATPEEAPGCKAAPPAKESLISPDAPQYEPPENSSQSTVLTLTDKPEDKMESLIYICDENGLWCRPSHTYACKAPSGLCARISPHPAPTPDAKDVALSHLSDLARQKDKELDEQKQYSDKIHNDWKRFYDKEAVRLNSRIAEWEQYNHHQEERIAALQRRLQKPITITTTTNSWWWERHTPCQ